MKNNYTNILDSFNFNEYKTASSIRHEIKKADHIEATKIIKKYDIAQPYDYIRACGKSNFTDFALKKLERSTEGDSKYIISRKINNKVIYLYTDKLLEKVEEMKWLESRGYFDNVQSQNYKIKGYFKDENEITIGKKSTGEIKILLDEADINSIVKRKYYLFDKKHLTIQAQLGALGIYFGYASKLARNDKNSDIYGVNLNTVCTVTMDDLELSKLVSEESYDKVDFVDVIWREKNIAMVSVAIEVEFNGEWEKALLRLFSVSQGSSHSDKIINIIVSNYPKDYINIKRKASMDIFSALNIKSKLYYLSIQKLLSILEMRDRSVMPEIVKKRFFDELIEVR